MPPPHPDPESSDPSRHGAFRWLFEDRGTGDITIAQFPNPALWTFIGATVARRFVADGSTAEDVLGWAATAGLGWWAVDEVVRGVNPWRRLLGLGGCALVAADLARRLG